MKLKEKLYNNKKFQRVLEYKKSYDNLMSNPRTNALVKLSIWFVLILTLSLIINFGNSNKLDVYVNETGEVKFSNTSDGVKEYFSNIKSYQAIISLNDSSYLFSCSDYCDIEFNDEKFYFDGFLYHIVDGEKVLSDDSILLDLCKFSISNISSLISGVDDDYFTIFKDGSYSTLYSVVSRDFFIDLDSDQMISVKFTGNNGVNSVEFDFSNLQIDDFYDKVFIEYSNISMEDL